MSDDSKKDEWTASDVAKIVVNPVYTGLGKYPRIVTDEQWLAAANRYIDEHGRKKFLRDMLAALHETPF